MSACCCSQRALVTASNMRRSTASSRKNGLPVSLRRNLMHSRLRSVRAPRHISANGRHDGVTESVHEARMDAAEVIALADAMRAYALESGRDLNDANLFTHTMLMRKVMAERNDLPSPL